MAMLLGLPLRVEFADCRADRESPGKNGEVLEFIRHRVAVLRFFRRNSRLEHFFGLPGDVIKHFADPSDTFLSANLPVSGDEQRVLIERGKFLQGVPPARNRRLLVEAHRIPAAEEQVPGVDHR